MQLSKSKIFLIILGLTLITVALSIGLIFTLSPTKNAPSQPSTFAATDGNWTYTVSNNQATITAYSVNTTGTLTIPNTLGGYPVVAIGSASSSSSGVFYNDSFSYVSIPSTITTIGDYAFYNCRSLLEINLPSNLTTLGKYSFCSCSAITKLTIPGKVTAIGENCFSSCSNLTQLDFATGITNITYGNGAFSCPNITIVNLSNTMTNLPNLSNCTLLKNLIIPNNIQNVVGLPTTLTTLTIGEGVKTMSGQLPYLTTLNYNAINADDVYSSDASNGYIFTKIGSSTASGTTINIGSKVQKIPNRLFYAEQENSNNYTTISFASNSVCKSIGEESFYNCNKLTSVNLPDSLETIGYRAFYNCYALKEITLGLNLTSINFQAFVKCNSLTELNINSIALDNINTQYIFNQVAGVACTINIGTQVTKIPNNFIDNFAVKAINFLPTSKCQHIGDYAFSFGSNSTITNLILPDSLISIGNNAFLGGTYLKITDLVIPDSVQSIGNTAFTYIQTLQTLTIGEGLISLGAGTFNYSYNLTTINYNAINLPDFTTNWNWFQGSGNTSQSITLNIGSKVKHIPAYLFGGSSSNAQYITSINFAPGSVCESIGREAFRSNTKITSINLPNTIQTIGYYAFGGCTAVTSLKLSTNLISLDQGAFNGHRCTSIYFMQSSNFTVGTYAFSGNSSCIYYFASQSVLDLTKTNYGTTSYFSSTNFQLITPIVLTLTAGDGCASVSGGGNYISNSTATAIATPSNSTFTFVGWYNGNTRVSTANPYSFTITANTNLTAHYQLNITFQASTGGTVSNAGGNCTPGVTITSTATPSTHYQFSHWIETANGATTRHTTATISRTANYKASFVAYFTLKNYTIKIANSNTSQGSIKIAQNGTILDATTLNTTAQAYTNYTIIASASNGYTFIGWQNSSGAIASTNPILSMQLLANTDYTAVFGKAIDGINITATYGGMAAIIGDNFSSLLPTDTITLVATVCMPNYQFSHWQNQDGLVLASGEDNKTYRIQKSQAQNSIITAVFVPI